MTDYQISVLADTIWGMARTLEESAHDPDVESILKDCSGKLHHLANQRRHGMTTYDPDTPMILGAAK